MTTQSQFEDLLEDEEDFPLHGCQRAVRDMTYLEWQATQPKPEPAPAREPRVRRSTADLVSEYQALEAERQARRATRARLVGQLSEAKKRKIALTEEIAEAKEGLILAVGTDAEIPLVATIGKSRAELLSVTDREEALESAVGSLPADLAREEGPQGFLRRTIMSQVAEAELASLPDGVLNTLRRSFMAYRASNGPLNWADWLAQSLPVASVRDEPQAILAGLLRDHKVSL